LRVLDKLKLLDHIKAQLRSDLELAIAAAKTTLDAATNEESKPENKYDTRGLEASYLAGAQAKRVGDIEEVLYLFNQTQIRNFKSGESISVMALVEVKLSGKISFVLLMPKGGGQIITFEGQVIQVITTHSPLGKALVGLQAGDTAMVESGKTNRTYEILSVV
jgi:Transcription elongation factor, GreA/GreB, C-term